MFLLSEASFLVFNFDLKGKSLRDMVWLCYLPCRNPRYVSLEPFHNYAATTEIR